MTKNLIAANWDGIAYPDGVHHAGQIGVFSQSPNENPRFLMWDLASQQVVSDEKVAQSPLINSGDLHGVARGIWHDGLWHCFFGSHNTTLMWSTSPDGITWTSPASIGSNVTYPRPLIDGSGDLQLWMRQGSTAIGYRMYQGGTNWGPFISVIDLAPYRFYTSDIPRRCVRYRDGRIVVAGFRQDVGRVAGYDAIQELYEGYYLESSDNGATWRAASGALLSLPVDLSQLNLYCRFEPDIGLTTWHHKTPAVLVDSATQIVVTDRWELAPPDPASVKDVVSWVWTGAAWEEHVIESDAWFRGAMIVNGTPYVWIKQGVIQRHRWTGSVWEHDADVLTADPLRMNAVEGSDHLVFEVAGSGYIIDWNHDTGTPPPPVWTPYTGPDPPPDGGRWIDGTIGHDT